MESRQKKRKRGRPPLGNRPLTMTEIKRRYRERKRTAGMREVTLMIGPEYVELIDKLAKVGGLSRTQMAQVFFDATLAQALHAHLAGKLVQLRGGSPDEIRAAVNKATFRPFDGLDELEEGYRQVAANE